MPLNLPTGDDAASFRNYVWIKCCGFCDRSPQPGHTNPIADESRSLSVADLHLEFLPSETVAGLGGFVLGALKGHAQNLLTPQYNTFGAGLVGTVSATTYRNLL